MVIPHFQQNRNTSKNQQRLVQLCMSPLRQGIPPVMRLPKLCIRPHFFSIKIPLMRDHPSYVTILVWQKGWSHKGGGHIRGGTTVLVERKKPRLMHRLKSATCQDRIQRISCFCFFRGVAFELKYYSSVM